MLLAGLLKNQICWLTFYKFSKNVREEKCFIFFEPQAGDVYRIPTRPNITGIQINKQPLTITNKNRVIIMV